jgi:cytochrome c oxidase subunit III
VSTASKSDFRPPPRASAIGLWLVLAALAMLFIASMWLYILLRLHFFGRISDAQIHMPSLTWLSTLVLLAGSFTIHRAVVAIRREKLQICLKFLYITCVIAVLFLLVQSPCMATILQEHESLSAQSAAGKGPGEFAPVSAYGLVFVLILVHALHVLGGIVALAVVTTRARAGKYDHENFMGVQFAARYWHFLDVVWLAMFTMFLALG